MRKIPAVMATQHPDNALAPFWNQSGNGFINALQEASECLTCFEQLGVDEFMWDWEGKHADAAVVDKLLSEHHGFFARHQLAKDIFLTFRLPNIWNEKGYSLIQAMTSILIAEDFARDLGFKQRPLFEVILPMTERAQQLMKMHKLFESLAKFKSKTFNSGHKNISYLELIPLVEGVPSQLNIAKLLNDYLVMYKKHFKRSPEHLRVFLARSDPAMASGLLATVIANRLALTQIAEFGRSNKIRVFPIAGVGGLVFRGGLTPETAAEFVRHNPGFSTITLQSSFRYDYPVVQIKRAVKQLERKLPRTKIQLIGKSDQANLQKIAKLAETNYQATLPKIVTDLDSIFRSVPRRRERRLHIGLLAYQRKLGQQSLPRAITFTCGFYSLGIPPEFIGFGRTLVQLSDADLKLLMKVYPTLKSDLERAGRYFNQQNLERLAAKNKAWYEVVQDVGNVESIFGLKLGPKTYEQHAHKNLSASVLMAKNKPSILPNLITEMAMLRRSLG